MAKFEQKTIESFCKKYNVSNPDKKAKILVEITDTIYEYNMLVVKYEKEQDDYKKAQIERDIKEVEVKIAETFKDVLKK